METRRDNELSVSFTTVPVSPLIEREFAASWLEERAFPMRALLVRAFATMAFATRAFAKRAFPERALMERALAMRLRFWVEE